MRMDNRSKPEPADKIFISFIDIPASDSGIYHHAKVLAEQLEDEEKPGLYASEYVFKWEIPEEYIIHTVSLQTIIDRGLGMERYIGNDGIAPSTDALRCLMATEYLDDSIWQYEIGLNLGFMARRFGARAPLLDIAEQFIDDCTVELYLDKQDYYIYVRFGFRESPKQCTDYDQLRLRKDGIQTAIFEWWLHDETFILKYDQYIKSVSVLKESMKKECRAFEDGVRRGMYIDPGEENRELRKIQARHKRIKADIERSAVQLGL
jgi:hypothetical protein